MNWEKLDKIGERGFILVGLLFLAAVAIACFAGAVALLNIAVRAAFG